MARGAATTKPRTCRWSGPPRPPSHDLPVGDPGALTRQHYREVPPHNASLMETKAAWVRPVYAQFKRVAAPASLHPVLSLGNWGRRGCCRALSLPEYETAGSLALRENETALRSPVLCLTLVLPRA